MKYILTALFIFGAVLSLNRELLQTQCICDLDIYATKVCTLKIKEYETQEFGRGCLPLFNDTVELSVIIIIYKYGTAQKQSYKQ